MSSILSSQGVVLATAMAVSGTVILLALRLQKSSPEFPGQTQILRSCISTERKKKRNKSKRVHFADDVVDPIGDSQEFRRQHCHISNSVSSSSSVNYNNNIIKCKEVKEMPANRVALYNGILRGRLVNRLAYSC